MNTVDLSPRALVSTRFGGTECMDAYSNGVHRERRMRSADCYGFVDGFVGQ